MLKVSLVATLSMAIVIPVTTLALGSVPTVEAGAPTGVGPFPDQDDDFLPDAVEWIFLTDPNDTDTDSDGSPDFIDALSFGERDADLTPTLNDHSARFVVVSNTDENGNRTLWLLMLMHVLGGNLNSVQSLDIYVGDGATQVSLMPLLGQGQVHSRVFGGPEEGHMFAVFAFQMLDQNFATNLLPFTFGANVTLDGEMFSNDMPLFIADNVLSTIVEVENNSRFVIQPIGDTDYAQTFWANQRICTLDLLPLTPSTVTVVSAQCETAAGLYCPPTCRLLLGHTFSVPGGLSAVTGH